jgi:hypothetical protein
LTRNFTTAASSGRSTVAARPAQGHPLLTGALDEVCVFNRVLSKEETEALAGQKK